MEKIIFIQRIFAHYRKPIYDYLYNRLRFKLISTNLYTGIPQSDANYSIKVPYFKYGFGENNLYIFSIHQLIKYRPKVVIHEMGIGILSMPVILIMSKLFPYKFILYGHCYNRKIGFDPNSRFQDKYRLWLLKKSNAVIVYGKYDKKLLSNYISSDKIYVAQNTLDTTTLTVFKNKLDKEGVLNVRKRLNWSTGYHLTFIGRLLPSKFPDLLVRTIHMLKEKFHIECYAHIIGLGPMINELKELAQTLTIQKNIIFYGAIHDDLQSGELLYASDLLVNPGYLGLSVNHSFCFGCPVVSFKQGKNGPFHSPEIEYVINGETGFLVNEQSIEALTSIIYNYLIDNKLQIEMRRNIEKCVQNIFPVEKMVNGIVDAIHSVLIAPSNDM